eukprot:gene10679-14341_t
MNMIKTKTFSFSHSKIKIPDSSSLNILVVGGPKSGKSTFLSAVISTNISHQSSMIKTISIDLDHSTIHSEGQNFQGTPRSGQKFVVEPFIDSNQNIQQPNVADQPETCTLSLNLDNYDGVLNICSLEIGNNNENDSSNLSEFVKNVDGVIILFDLTTLKHSDVENSFFFLKSFVDPSTIPVVVAATKSELMNKSQHTLVSTVSQLSEWCNLVFHRIISPFAVNLLDVDEVNDLLRNLLKIILVVPEEDDLVEKIDRTKDEHISLKNDDELSEESLDLRSYSNTLQNESTDDPAANSGAINIIIVGNTFVGKSTLLARYIRDYPEGGTCENSVATGKPEDNTYEPTIGVDFREIIVAVEERLVKINVWDTSGNPSMKNAVRTFYREVDCLVLVYDITSRESFTAVSTHLSDYIQSNQPVDLQRFPVILVGNKSDLSENRAVPIDEIIDFCQYQRPKNPIPFIECSASRGISVHEVFILIAELSYNYLAELGCVTQSDRSEGEIGDYDSNILTDDLSSRVSRFENPLAQKSLNRSSSSNEYDQAAFMRPTPVAQRSKDGQLVFKDPAAVGLKKDGQEDFYACWISADKIWDTFLESTTECIIPSIRTHNNFQDLTPDANKNKKMDEPSEAHDNPS